MAASISRAEAARRHKALEEALADGFKMQPQKQNERSALSEAAKRIGLARQTMQTWWNSPNRDGVEAVETKPPEPPPREDHDAAFWRKRANELKRSRDEAVNVADKLAGLSQAVPNVIPEWVADIRQGKSGKAVVNALVSDIHLGEVVDANEIDGVNAYDISVAARRIKQYFSAVCEIGSRWSSDTECVGAMVALAGDLVSGDIHEELRATNELTSLEQMQECALLLAAGIRQTAECFGRVHVVAVPGNHGRTTVKPTAKRYGRLSYDIAIARVLQTMFQNDGRVTFQADGQTDQVTPILGQVVFTTHGDNIGTKGGMGFAGPNLPIVRGGAKVQAQQAALGRTPHMIQHGHYHTTSNPGPIFANGSMIGVSEYGMQGRMGVEPPQQWMMLIHSRWRVRERLPVQLEDPPVVRPRVRVPAVMREAA